MSATYQLDLDELTDPPDAETIADARDPHDIVPEGFYDRWGSFADCVAAVEGDDTDDRRCPDCRAATIVAKRAPEFRAPGNRREGDYRCVSCSAHFDAPLAPKGEGEDQAKLPGVDGDV